MSDFIDTPIEYLKGVGPIRAELLKKELGIFKIIDLLEHFPFRYIDRSRIYTVAELNPDMPHVQLRGELKAIKAVGKGRTKRLQARFSDNTGTIEIVWFKGVSWLEKYLVSGQTYTMFGKPTLYKGNLNIAHPEMENPEQGNSKGELRPVYPLTEKLRTKKIDNRVIYELIVNALSDNRFIIYDFLPDTIRENERLVTLQEAYTRIHLPRNQKDIDQATRRLKFDEFFLLQIRIQKIRSGRQKLKGLVFERVGPAFNEFFNNHLKFELTGAQKRVIKEIRADMRSGYQMNRLLQGDVGSGKSIVALLCMLIAIDNGFQASIMAPTEILAQQHFEGMSPDLEKQGIKVALLTGSTKTAERKEIHEQLLSGEIKILIGTHALIEDKVKLRNQGLVVIDEQHRFGVAQRAKLWKKSKTLPHVLVMTATPIPRTLAMTIYGDLDVSKIDELPVGRKPIKTAHRLEENRLRVLGFIKEQVKQGRQVYIVFPLIEESQKLDFKNLHDGYDQLVMYFKRPEYQVDMIHGRMTQEEKDAAMNRFKLGISHILVSTTVIEVGINVPNATTMVIESAEKFGLSQLHQLRGRVGRGSEQSYCILMTKSELTAHARKRMKAMTESTDGFKIAEMDMKLRGPGEIEGTRQSGILDFKLANITEDEGLLTLAREYAIQIIQEDPNLKLSKHAQLIEHLRKNDKYRDWSLIS